MSALRGSLPTFPQICLCNGYQLMFFWRHDSVSVMEVIALRKQPVIILHTPALVLTTEAHPHTQGETADRLPTITHVDAVITVVKTARPLLCVTPSECGMAV